MGDLITALAPVTIAVAFFFLGKWWAESECRRRAALSEMDHMEAVGFLVDDSNKRRTQEFDDMHRRAQRAESATAKARREAIGQRKRAEWWRERARECGYFDDQSESIAMMKSRIVEMARMEATTRSLEIARWFRKERAWVYSVIDEIEARGGR